MALVWTLPLVPGASAAVVFDDSFEGSFKPVWTQSGNVALLNSFSHGWSWIPSGQER